MPGMDGSGPLGQGPRTGRGLGPCGQGRACGLGLGRGRGGRGLGLGRRAGAGWMQGAVGSVADDAEVLRAQQAVLEQQLETLKQRLGELEGPRE